MCCWPLDRYISSNSAVAGFDANDCRDARWRYLAVVFWGIRKRNLICVEIIPRSVRFAEFEQQIYLLCALGDGHLFTFGYEMV